MADETKEATKDSSTVTERTDSVTDEMLEAALRGSQSDEEVKTEEVKTEEGTEEKIEEAKEEAKPKTAEEEEAEPPPSDPNAMRSWIGRREARLEKKLLSSIDKLLSSRMPPKAEPVPTTVEDDELPEIIATADDVRKVNQIDRKREEREVAAYQTGYAETLRTIAAGEGEEYQSVEDEIFNPETNGIFNKRITGKPDIDAKMNFLAAKNAVLSKKLAAASSVERKVVPGRGDSPKGTAVTVTTKNAVGSKPALNLSQDAKDYLKFCGKDEEWAREVAERR
jgi:hypothetical protein